MKILSCGDLHGDGGLARKLAKKANDENVDVVIICGDITNSEESTKGLIGPFLKFNKRVLIVPGNHESLATADFLSKVYDIKNLHGYSVKIPDKNRNIGIFGCSAVNLGIHQLPDKESYDLLKKGHDYIKTSDIKIMVTHVHPAGSTIEKFTQFFEGSKAVKRAIDKFQPDIMLCAHVHEAEGLEEKIGKTRVINVGSKGKIFEI